MSKITNFEQYLKYYFLEDYLFGEVNKNFKKRGHLTPEEFFAIELEDYNDKEKLLKEIFNKHCVGDSELFALDYDLVRQLLLSFEGKVIYPKDVNKEKEFEEVSKAREQGARFSFYKKGI